MGETIVGLCVMLISLLALLAFAVWCIKRDDARYEREMVEMRRLSDEADECRRWTGRV